MELGYEDFPEDGTRVRASLLPFDGDRYSRAQKLFRIGSITAACVGALAIVGLLSSPATKAAPESVDAKVSSVSTLAAEAPVKLAAPATSRFTTTSLATTEGKGSKESAVFDKDGRFVMEDFDRAKPMASFLPGVGGKWGVPMWAFYVNRGQGMATFGVENKDGGIALFQTAEKTYQVRGRGRGRARVRIP